MRAVVIKPCIRGHNSERYANGVCKECQWVRNRDMGLRQRYKATKARWRRSEKAKAYDASPERKAANRARERVKRLLPEVKARNRKRDIWRAYKLSVEQYDKLLAVFVLNGCPCCGREADVTKKRSFALDHDHACCDSQYTCGKCIRAMICASCNWAIALFDDEPMRLRMAANYLESHRPPFAGTNREVAV